MKKENEKTEKNKSAMEEKAEKDVAKRAKKQRSIKKTGTFQGKSNKLGGGGRFKQLVAQGKSPALAAWIGRKTLGAKKFNSLSAKARAKK